LKKIAILMAAAVVWQAASANEPRLELDDCINQAAVFHRVNPKVLKAIVFQESSGRHWIVTKNSNQTYDYGASGINSVHLPELSRHGITAKHLMDGCTNVFVGAWKYSKKVARYGNTWKAVGAYHSETPERREAYSARIQNHLLKWGVISRYRMAKPESVSASAAVTPTIQRVN
jgi:hypothetical protein